MMKKRSGTVVNISSIVGIHGNWGQTNYAASKAGIIGFTKSLARELGSRNVRANVVVPGYVKTQLTDVLPEDATGAMLQNTPLGRLGDPEDVAGRRTVPLLRRGVVHHGRGAARRRRAGDVGMTEGANNGRRRVVITGVGMVTPLGNDPDSTWENLVAGKSGAGPDHALRHGRTTTCTSPASSRISTRRSGSTASRRGAWTVFPSSRSRRRGWQRRTAGSRSPQRRIVSALPSLPGSAGSTRSRLLPEPARARPRPHEPVLDRPDHPEHGRRVGLDGARRARARLRPSATACAASNMAIGDGLDAIRLGRADVMFCGGTEAPITRVGIAGFTRHASALEAQRRSAGGRRGRSTRDATAS